MTTERDAEPDPPEPNADSDRTPASGRVSDSSADASAFLSALRLSDSFLPVGGYTASYGLEQYINEDRIGDGDDLRELIAAYLRRVVGPCETVALANAHAASAAGDLEALLAVDERLHAVTMPREFRESSTKAGAKLCELLAETDTKNGAEGSDETESDGSDLESAFVDAVAADETPGHYPVAFGVVAQARGLSRREACLAHAHSFVTGLLGAAQRLGRFGHTDIQSVLAALEPAITAVCERHVDDEPEAMVSFAPLAEIMGMRHERAGRRLFMS
ncbi:urease accessory protein UreF [Haloterrigena sp. SYSU A558-1]|uniref:Urease accessory protein UreF n=1 Tax=Haloterrigena gelatinilytica TaxID=2741724 RepID=A0ABX2LET2_9EURY|nr:urease accessory UreF family protein [Haloterrigena gelatinilytica]NUC72351.1 urease accessory protein UreF [Haloterrigena gelatinilytica]